MPEGVTYQFNLTLDGAQLKAQAQQVHEELLNQLSLPKDVLSSYDTLISKLKEVSKAAGEVGKQIAVQANTQGLGAVSGVTPLTKLGAQAAKSKIDAVTLATKADEAAWKQQRQALVHEQKAIADTNAMVNLRAQTAATDLKAKQTVLSAENQLLKTTTEQASIQSAAQSKVLKDQKTFMQARGSLALQDAQARTASIKTDNDLLSQETRAIQEQQKNALAQQDAANLALTQQTRQVELQNKVTAAQQRAAKLSQQAQQAQVPAPPPTYRVSQRILCWC